MKEHELSKQYRQFLDRITDFTQNYSGEKLDKIDPKELIKIFMRREKLYKGIELDSLKYLV